ncbi:MAG: fatty acid desaturase [Verrucomicrobiota bacterium]
MNEAAYVNTVSSRRRPRTGKDLILATRPYAVDHTMTSWWHILSTATLLVLVLAAILLSYYSAVKIAFSILAGLLILRLFVIYHDQQHHAILPKSWIMEIFMRGFGILALSPSSIWRSSHNHHHKHNSKIKGAHIGSFPIMTKAHYLKSSRTTKLAYLCARHPLTILFGYLFVFLYGMCLKPFLAKPREHLTASLPWCCTSR